MSDKDSVYFYRSDRAENYFVIRTDPDNRLWIESELCQGRLRQGWGIPGTQLKEEIDEISVDNWVQNYRAAAQKYWDTDVTEDEARKRYWILYPLTKVRRGDVIVIPKLPDDTHFIITIAVSGYRFEMTSLSQANFSMDFHHVIDVDREHIKNFSYFQNPETMYIQQQMREDYRYAVNTVTNKEFIKNINKLFESYPRT